LGRIETPYGRGSCPRRPRRPPQTVLGQCVRASIASYEAAGLILKRRWRRGFTVTYGEILTAERLASIWGLRLHTRTSDPVRLACRGAARVAIENEIRRRGVRVVDEHGAMIALTQG